MWQNGIINVLMLTLISPVSITTKEKRDYLSFLLIKTTDLDLAPIIFPINYKISLEIKS